MAYKDYINHNSFGLSWKHKELPIVAQTGFDFYRYVTFTDDMYGKTISELHQGNLRAVTNNKWTAYKRIGKQVLCLRVSESPGVSRE